MRVSSGDFTSEQVPWVSDSVPVRPDTGESLGAKGCDRASFCPVGYNPGRLLPRGLGWVITRADPGRPTAIDLPGLRDKLAVEPAF